LAGEIYSVAPAALSGGATNAAVASHPCRTSFAAIAFGRRPGRNLSGPAIKFVSGQLAVSGITAAPFGNIATPAVRGGFPETVAAHQPRPGIFPRFAVGNALAGEIFVGTPTALADGTTGRKSTVARRAFAVGGARRQIRFQVFGVRKKNAPAPKDYCENNCGT